MRRNLPTVVIVALLLLGVSFASDCVAESRSEPTKLRECVDSVFLRPGTTENSDLSHELMVTVRVISHEVQRERQLTLSRKHHDSAVEVTVLDPVVGSLRQILASRLAELPNADSTELCSRIELSRIPTRPLSQEYLRSALEALRGVHVPAIPPDYIVVHGTHYTVYVWTVAGSLAYEFDGVGCSEEESGTHALECWVADILDNALSSAE